MKFGKRLCAFVLSAVMLLASVPAVSAANGTIIMNLGSNMMTVNGNTVAIDVDPAIKPQVQTVNGFGYTMLPLRAVVESMGGQVYYDIATKNITMTYNGTTVTHVIGTSTAYVNGVPRELSIASYAANNRTYVHLRAIELLSSSIAVNWSADAPDRVEIVYPQNAPVTILPDAPVILDPGTTENETIDILLTFHNEMDAKLVELYLAPAGTENYGENLLSRAINAGTAKDFDLKLVPGEYDVLGVDDDGDEYEWEDVELEEEELYLWLIDDGEYELTDDEDEEFEAEEDVSADFDEVSLLVHNQTRDTITELKVYPASDHDEPLYTYSEKLREDGSISFTLEDLDEAYIAIYVQHTYYDYAMHADRHNITVYSKIKLTDDSVKITLEPYSRFEIESYEANDAVYFRNETGQKIIDLRTRIDHQDEYSGNLLDKPLADGETVRLEGLSCLELCGESLDISVTTDRTREKSVLIDDELTNSMLLSMDRNHKITVRYDADEESYRSEGLYLRNDSSDNFDALYILNQDMIDEDEFEFDFRRGEIADYFEDHPADNSSAYDDYEAEDYYVKVKNFDRKDTVYIDEWSADDLHECHLLIKADSDGYIYYGEIRVSSIDEFTYNILVSVEIDRYDEIDGDVVDTDIAE